MAYDCFGAGQHVVQVTFGGGGREPAMFPLLPIVRALHELLWYLAEVEERAAPERDAARAATDPITRLARGTPDALRAADVDAERAAVDPLLRRASALVRASHHGRPPAGRAPAGRPVLAAVTSSART